MAEQSFRVPRIGSGKQTDAYRPKYSDLEGIDGVRVQREFPEESEYIALFRGDKEAIQEINDEDDTVALSEAEVGRLQQQGIGKSPLENGPQRPEMGEGNSIKERAEDYIENECGSSFVDGGKYTKPIKLRGGSAFYDGQIGLLDLHELRNFPKYLTDAILRPEAAVILNEHYRYWDWTAQFVSYIDDEDIELLTSGEINESIESVYDGVVGDFIETVCMIRFPRRLDAVNPRVQRFIMEMSGIPDRIDSLSLLRLFGPNSLAVLDGLIKRRCGLTEDGNLKNSNIKCSWRPDSPDRSSLSYHDRLQYWRHYKAVPETEEVLAEIDDLQRYNIDYLRKMGGVLGNTDKLDEELSSTNHFLRILGTSQRNYNIHGNGSAPSIAPLALNLCCLIIWDAINEETHQQYQEEILQELRKS